MKYIIIPILKFIAFLFIIFVFYPIIGFILLLFCVWEGSWHDWKEFWNQSFQYLEYIQIDEKGKYFINNKECYKTAWDWCRGKKTIIYDIETL